MKTVTGNEHLGIGITNPNHQIELKCECGNSSVIDTNFKINIILLQFRCNQCKKVITIPDNILFK